jgi:purine-binding chemotaxis protein CheW
MKASPKTAGASGAAVQSPAPARQDYLVFRLADREYGLVLGKVKELCNYDIVKPLSCAPPAITGVITLHSRKIAVADLREILAPGSGDRSRLTDVVVLDIGGHASGIAVDCVIDVVSVQPGQIHAADAPGMLGIAEVGARTVALLDADKLTTDFQPASPQKLAACLSEVQ